jgi:hypothetical protein
MSRARNLPPSRFRGTPSLPQLRTFGEMHGAMNLVGVAEPEIFKRANYEKGLGSCAVGGAA